MNKYALGLLITVAVIFALGLSMVFNTTAAEVLDRSLTRGTHHALIRQVLYAVMGGVIGVGVWFVGYRTIIKLSRGLLIFGTLLLILVFVPGIGAHINGANRWINIFGNSFQPSELMKFIIPIHYIHMIIKLPKPIALKTFIKLLATLCIPIGLILIEPDNGTVAIILSSLVVLFLLSKMKWVYWALPLLIVTMIGAIAASQMPHVSDRIRVYLHPESDLKGKGHQPYQAKIAAGSGKLFGKGIGMSMQKLDYLPEARSDYIAAIFAEEFGFIGMLFLLFLYMLFGFFGFQLAQNACDREGFYLISILTFLICFQAFLNLGVVSGLLPSKGTNLPFFSHGGSSLLANFLALFLILNASYSRDKIHA